METIVQSIAEKIYVIEFHSTHPKLFSCGNTFNLEMVLLLNELKIIKTLRFIIEPSYNKVQGSDWGFQCFPSDPDFAD